MFAYLKAAKILFYVNGVILYSLLSLELWLEALNANEFTGDGFAILKLNTFILVSEIANYLVTGH